MLAEGMMRTLSSTIFADVLDCTSITTVEGAAASWSLHSPALTDFVGYGTVSAKDTIGYRRALMASASPVSPLLRRDSRFFVSSSSA